MTFIAVSCLVLVLFYVGMRFQKALFISVILCGAVCVWATSQAVSAFEDASKVAANPKAVPKCGKNDACLAAYAQRLGEQNEANERRLFASLAVAAFALASALSVVARERSRRKVAQKWRNLETAAEKHASMDEIRKLMRLEETLEAEVRDQEVQETQETTAEHSVTDAISSDETMDDGSKDASIQPTPPASKPRGKYQRRPAPLP